MTIAVLLAGGIDPGFQMDIAKQFVNVYNVPIIVYTMKKFQKHPEVDSIMVACLSGWENLVSAYAKQFNIDKLQWVIEGGRTGQETSRLAANKLMESCREDDIVIIHDAIRPMVCGEIISDSIATCKQKGMGIAAVTSMDNVMMTDDGITGKMSISRYAFRRVQTPQTYRLGDLHTAHAEALKQNIKDENDTNNMMSRLGKKVTFAKGSDTNVKINTVEDVEMFKALFKMQNEEI